MRLLVISHTPHYRSGAGHVGWAATVRELDTLASRFSTVRHIAVLHAESPPANVAAYTAPNIELVPVPASGGEGLHAKLGILQASRIYAATITRELATADLVHVRAPASIALIAIAILASRRQPRLRWFKYAGSWRPQQFDHASYALQRWLLRSHLAGGVVTVNGDVTGAPAWVRAFYNPSLDRETLARGKQAAAHKQLDRPLRLVYAGRVDRAKGAVRAVDIVERCVAHGLDVELDIAGDGSARAELEARTSRGPLAGRVRFAGWLAPSGVEQLYRRAHLSLLPSQTEGWPKVLSEAMAFGVVPVASRVGAIPAYLERWRVGAALAVDAIDDYVAAITGYVDEPERWRAEAERAVEAAQLFSFDHYLTEVDSLLAEMTACAS